MNYIHESMTAWKQDADKLAARGVRLQPTIRGYITPELRSNPMAMDGLAMDAQAPMNTTASAAIPSILTTWIDPKVIEVVFAPLKSTEILPQKRIGDWNTMQAMFPLVEAAGEVTTYGDYDSSGSNSLNVVFPQRQNYLWQTGIRYGDHYVEMMGLARINAVTSLQKQAADALNKYENWVQFYGVAGIQNYGILNDPSLPASITPGTKSAGNGNVWMYQGAPNATANEVFADIQSLFWQLTTQTQGIIQASDQMVLALGPGPHVALSNTNAFGLTAMKIIKENFPNLRIVSAPQYESKSSTFIEGYSSSGNFCQLIAETIAGDPTGYTSYSDKLHAHRLVPHSSYYEQKWSAGSFGAVIPRPIAFASMLGI
jgi:hypothetical protein